MRKETQFVSLHSLLETLFVSLYTGVRQRHCLLVYTLKFVRDIVCQFIYTEFCQRHCLLYTVVCQIQFEGDIWFFIVRVLSSLLLRRQLLNCCKDRVEFNLKKVVGAKHWKHLVILRMPARKVQCASIFTFGQRNLSYSQLTLYMHLSSNFNVL